MQKCTVDGMICNHHAGRASSTRGWRRVWSVVGVSWWSSSPALLLTPPSTPYSTSDTPGRKVGVVMYCLMNLLL